MFSNYKKPEFTKEAIDENVWFHIGLAGFIEPKNRVCFTGRTHKMFRFIE